MPDDMEDRRRAARAKLAAGGWLTSGELALVLRVSPRTAVRMLADGVIASQQKPGTATLRVHRVADPAAVRAYLATRYGPGNGTNTALRD